jgi:hypothetical protein
VLEGVVVPIGEEGAKAQGGGLVADVAKDGGGPAGEEEEGFVDEGIAAAEGPAGRIGLERLDPFVAAEGEVAGVLDEAEGVGPPPARIWSSTRAKRTRRPWAA